MRFCAERDCLVTAAVPRKGFSMLRGAVSVGKGFVHVKSKVYAYYAWVQGRQEWCRKTWMFNAVWFWRACFWVLIMTCHLYRTWDSATREHEMRNPACLSPDTPPSPSCTPHCQAGIRLLITALCLRTQHSISVEHIQILASLLLQYDGQTLSAF